jgi:hypothetical protein
MVDFLSILLGIAIGILIQRIFLARCKGLFHEGSSWFWSKNKLFRKLHRIYCETCPRRLYCEQYKKEIEKCQKT